MFKLNDSYTFSYAKYANTDERLNVYTRHGLLSFNMTRATFDRFIEFIKSIKFQTDFERLETIVVKVAVDTSLYQNILTLMVLKECLL